MMGNLLRPNALSLLWGLPIVLLFGSIASNAAAQVPSRPNVVFIYADDFRWDAMGVVQAEQGEKARFPWLRTPRMDRLASESVRFRQAFVVCSLCSPGRASVLTGRYGHSNGIVNNYTPISTSIPNLATRLKEAGYSTGYFGKFHMDGQRERPGFDRIASFVGQGRYFDCPLLVDGVETPTKGWVDDVTTDYAIRFLTEQPRERPFFVFLGFKSPHGPRGGENLPERVRDLYSGEASRPTPNTSIRAIYMEQAAGPPPSGPRSEKGHLDYMRHISAIDDCVGRVLDALDTAGQTDRTIVVLTSDNGYYLGEHGLGDKRSAYDESLRVPLLVRLPGPGAPRGTTNDNMVLNIDHAPTILDFAGAPPLGDAHGRSMRPLLVGRDAPDWRTAFLYEYFQERGFNAPTVLAFRTATHKLITYPGQDAWTEVFDLAADPYETQNLVSDTKLLERLRAGLEARKLAVSFQVPEITEPPRQASSPGKKAAKDSPKKKSATKRSSD